MVGADGLVGCPDELVDSSVVLLCWSVALMYWSYERVVVPNLSRPYIIDHFLVIFRIILF